MVPCKRNSMLNRELPSWLPMLILLAFTAMLVLLLVLRC